MKKTQIRNLGKTIRALSQRIAIAILMEATKDDYLNELAEELDELTAAAEMLKLLKFPTPTLVDEVFRQYIEAMMDPTAED